MIPPIWVHSTTKPREKERERDPQQETKHKSSIGSKRRSIMVSVSTSMFLKSLFLVTLLLGSISAEKDSVFSFRNFEKKLNINSTLALFGDSKVVNGSSSIEITGFSKSNAGRVFYKTPIKLVEGNPERPVSFLTHFVFSMSPGIGDGLAFVMVPLGFPLDSFDGGSFGMLNNGKFRTLSVEFDTKLDKKFGDFNANRVGIDLNSLVSVKSSNVSKAKLVLNSGEKLEAWIDYEASAKRFEIRLTKLGERKPANPLLSCTIDVSHMWEEEVFIGLSSSNGNSSQKCDLYSWDFKIRQVPLWMHSEPLDPEAVLKNTEARGVPRERDCHLKVLGALIFGVSCGALGAFFALFVWTVFLRKRPVVPEEFPSKGVEFEPEKFKVVVVKSIEEGKK